MAALYGCNIIRLEQEEGPAYGAAILAGVGTGVYDDVRDVSKKLARCGRVTVPDEEEAAVYRRYHDLYDRLYDHMKQDLMICMNCRGTVSRWVNNSEYSTDSR